MRFLGILIVLITIAVFSAVAMVLWNAIMPDIFGLPALNYWQAAGILILAHILFGGIGKGLFMPGYIGRDGRDMRHGNLLREKWMSMPEEARKAFIEKEKKFHHFFHDRFSHYQDCCNEKEKKSDKKETAASPKGGSDE
jgi:hypothetical protein